MRSGKPFSAGKSSFKGKNPKDSSTFRGYGKNEDRNVFQKPNHEEQDGKDEKLGFPRYSDVEILEFVKFIYFALIFRYNRNLDGF